MVRARPRGFVLAELVVAMVIAAIIGVALTQLVISQSRFAALQGGITQARGGARAALNVLANDLRMVSDSGLVAAAHDSVTVRVPFAFGVACAQSGGTTIVSLLPSDSASYFSASISGYAWRDTTTSYVFVQPATVSNPNANLSFCTGATPPITTLTASAWTARAVAVSPNDVRTPPGAVVYLYQLVRYAFAPSGQLPGRIGLWRTVLSTGQRDELVAPFDTSASFQFLDSVYAPHVAPPANLTKVQGLRLLLVATSEQAPEGRTKPTTFNITTNVLFQNHP
jgi:prepilin-type N-terminal cleavage/methylation domain-containing protein